MTKLWSLACSRAIRSSAILAVLVFATPAAWGADAPIVEIPNSTAASEKEMKPYTDMIVNTPVKFDMVPIPGGTFTMGSPDSEAGRGADEGLQHQVKLSPFWMGRCEVTWDEYEAFMFSLDIQRRKVLKVAPTDRENLADAVTRPTKPYTDMTFDMGKDGFPAICMTQHAAKMYCEWLSTKTGRYYRLPTEAEWEYACRAGTKTAYSFGDDPKQVEEYAWYGENTTDDEGNQGYRKVGKKKPNPWGLHDMHGNVCEWVIDTYDTEFYKRCAGEGVVENPLNLPKVLEGRVVRGGSWQDSPEKLRCAARVFSTKEWKQQDPQIPQSIWYYTDALFVGFRVVRPLVEPDAATKAKYSSDKIQSVKQ